MKFFTENKKILLWVLCAAAVVAACVLWVVFSGNGETSGDEGVPPSSSAPGSAGSSSQGTPPANGSASLTDDEIYGVLDSTMCMLNPLSTRYVNRPTGLNPGSSQKDCAQYVAMRLGVLTTPYTAISRDLASNDQDQLFWYVHKYINYVMLDNEENFLVPAQRKDGVFVYDKATVSGILEDIFGIKDYVIQCQYYDSTAGTYTVTDYGGGGIPPLQYVGDVKWNGNDAFTCSVYFYPRTNEKVLQVEDWELKVDLKLERSAKDPNEFYVSQMTQNEK